MTCEATTSTPSARQAWLAVLARASRAQLEDALPQTDAIPKLTYVRPVEVGMIMLRGRIGGTGNPFNVGEASVARCAVRLGDGPLGVGYVMGRDKRRAELVAIFDALLQDPVRRDAVQKDFIATLAQQQLQARQQQHQAVAGSKVEFFTFVRGEA